MLLPAGDDQAAGLRSAQVAGWLSEVNHDAEILRVPTTRAALWHRLATLRGSMLLLDAAGPTVTGGHLPGTIDAAGCDVFLVSRR